MLLRRDRAMLAITLVLDVAFHAGRSGTVSATDIADRLGAARRGLEPLLQSLTRAGILDSLRGPRGGYRLGRPARGVRLADIVAAIGTPEAESAETGPQGALQDVVVTPLWEELNQGLQSSIAAITIEDLLKRAAQAGLQRPAAEPLDWVI
jgi:Rrf2 family transcriptional regulator, iron-sulfur cluster assembly transcription factor